MGYFPSNSNKMTTFGNLRSLFARDRIKLNGIYERYIIFNY